MRGIKTGSFSTGLAAGLLVAVAVELFVSPVGSARAIARGDVSTPAVSDASRPLSQHPEPSVMQYVDRSGKGDRLDARPTEEKVLAGCEPAFSPLSVSARADNFARRCMASLDVPVRTSSPA